MIKFYARQVPPEHQTSPLYLFSYSRKNGLDLSEEYPGITLTGNRDFSGYEDENFRTARENIREAAEAWTDAALKQEFYFTKSGYPAWRVTGRNSKPKDDNGDPVTIRGILQEYGIERPDGKQWTTHQRHEWKELFEEYDADDAGDLCKALSLLTGKSYDWKYLRGCCQGDWIECYFPVDEYDRKRLDILEMEYFNTGSEWTVHDGDPDGDENNDCFSCYCYSWDDDGIREELAAAAGCSPEDLFLIGIDDDETRTA